MARPKKDNVPVSFRMDKTIHEEFTKYCKDSGQSKTVAMERAIDMYIKDYYKKQEKLRSR